MVLSEKEITSFWAKVDRRGPDECWLWTANVLKNGPNAIGYGQFTFGGKTRRATHAALIIDGRPRPGNLFALHSCDNPQCVNPKHLRWGTRLENTMDAFKRGRIPRSLTDEQVRMIRADERPETHIAAELGVHQVIVSGVRRGTAYAYVE